MKIKEYISKFENSTEIMETKYFWTQCVALAKHFSLNVLNIKLSSFWGSAYTGWLNLKNTFKSHLWNKIVNDLNDKNQVPPVGSIIFFDKTKKNGYYWHVAVVTKAILWKAYFEVINQNVWNWNWKWYDDSVKISKFYYKKDKVSGWYVKKETSVKIDYEKKYFELIEKLKNLI